MKSQQAYESLLRGIASFQAEAYPARREAFAALAHQQEPLALFITCSDSRIVPSLITQTGPGELFVERNPGNLIPRCGDLPGVSCSVEFAMLVLKVPLIIICGHSDCGAMKALLHAETAENLPEVKQWMRHAAAAHDRLKREAANVADDEKLLRLTEFNVRAQIENLKTHPSVQSRLAAGEVEIHGWVYDVGSGSIAALDAKTGRFAAVG